MNDKQPEKRTTIEDQLYNIGLCLFAVLPLAVILYRYLQDRLPLLTIPCILHTFTGYYCPGYGGTRAVYALMQLQLWKSFCYHPLVPYAAVVYLWFMLSHTIEKLSRHRLHIGMKWNPAWLWAALVILLVNVLVKDAALFLFPIDLL